MTYNKDSLIVFGWFQKDIQERYVPPLRDGRYSQKIPLRSITTYVRYLKLFQDQDPQLYGSKVERAECIIDRYDAVRRRVSGRFSFRVIGSLGGEVIDIREGTFENVRF